jgi:hypothetical protein
MTEPDESPGLPGLRSWRAVYIFVLVCFVLYIFGLALVERLVSP